ncbi:hypothetical protein NQ314_008364 [Rhamnusium bicolor]|uniref:Nose resistant-to-fluoxetine protein N-terminal domain-containing protein n=1 Tax=Rhamnusium bicolor TaxID=1586634 RepID=A0AAV8YCH4_9CUCU|nr:hypothetical protein NQ314_008364 [Rhamnusium bicolor]
MYLKMLDATSKFPYSGLGYASRMDYGNFDQCLSINHNYAGGKILGKHCTAGLVIPDIFGNLSDFDVSRYIIFWTLYRFKNGHY